MRGFVLIFLLTLSGCMTVPEESSAPLIAARDFIVQGALPDDHNNFPMYGLIALSDRGRQDRKRNRWVCETFQNLPSTIVLQGGGVGSIPNNRITPTYWMLARDANRSSCDALLEQYDFERAQAVFSLANRAGQTGPMLIAVNGNRVAVIDISQAKKKWVKAMVAKWSQSIVASQGTDITVKSGPIADTCAILTGNEARRVQVAVWEVVGDDVTDGTPWWQTLANTARSFATELLPFGTKVEKFANQTCDEVNQTNRTA